MPVTRCRPSCIIPMNKERTMRHAFQDPQGQTQHFAVLYSTPTGQQHAMFPHRRAAKNAISYIKKRRALGKTDWRPIAIVVCTV